MSWREAIKKPVARPTAPKPKFDAKDDDWETDINYQNVTTEKSQRYGSTTVPGSGRIDHVDFKSIQEKIRTADKSVKENYQEKNPNRGYGGKFGKDQVMDKSAADFSYRADVAKHSSQTDFKKGFGGAHGIDEHAKDKSAVGFDYKAEVEKHSSQTDFSKGFGGKYGTDMNAQDKSAVGFSHKEVVPKHSSQKDYSVGFGGKYGVQKEEPSRLATVTTPPEPKYVEKVAAPISSSIGVGNIRARFENMKKEQEDDAAKRVAEERQKRAVFDQQTRSNDHENAKQKEISPSADFSFQPITSPPPPPAATFIPRPVTPPLAPAPSETPNTAIYENFSNKFETQRSTTNNEVKEEPARIVGGLNVSSLLRQRKASSSSSKHDDDDDDEWADDTKSHNQHQYENRNSSSMTTNQPEQTSNHDEGIRCVAHYGYQKIEDDELGFEEGEIITNVQKMHDEWWCGKIGPRSGLFPANYVEELQ